MAIRLYEGRMEFDYDSSDGTVKTTHTVYIESDGLYFNGKIYGTGYGTGSPVVTITGQYLAPDSPSPLHPDGIVPNVVPTPLAASYTIPVPATLGQYRFNAFFSNMGSGAVQTAFNPKQGKNFTLLIREPTGVTASTTRQLWPGPGGTAWDPTSEGAGGVQHHQFGFRNNGNMILGAGTGYSATPIPGANVDPFIDYFVSNAPSTVFTFEFHDSSYSPAVEHGSTGLSTGDFEFQPSMIAFGTNKLYTKADGSGVIFSGTIGATLDSTSVSPPAQGTVAGFASGGFVNTPNRVTTIDQFPFAISGGAATDVGDLIEARNSAAGQSSSTDGFATGGFAGLTPFSIIEKFPFAISGGTATDVGDLSAARSAAAGQSSNTRAFNSGGNTPPIASTIDKFPFSISSGTATDVGDLSSARVSVAGNSSSIEGFTSGGAEPSLVPSLVSTIDKFPFSIAGGTATDVGDIGEASSSRSGQQSETDGFSSGGAFSPTSFTANIFKFPFAISGGTATDVGDLSVARSGGTGQSSSGDGFNAGGTYTPTLGITAQIDKFPFAISAGTATDVGDLSQVNTSISSQQD